VEDSDIYGAIIPPYFTLTASVVNPSYGFINIDPLLDLDPTDLGSSTPWASL